MNDMRKGMPHRLSMTVKSISMQQLKYLFTEFSISSMWKYEATYMSNNEEHVVHVFKS